MADTALRATLLEIERRGWDSLCDGTGAQVYGALMTDDAVMVLANGAVMDRAAVVDSLGHAPPWGTYAISDVRLTEAGSGTAVLGYVGRAYRDAEAPAFVAVMASVYVRSGETWRLAHYQQTPVSDASE